MSAENNEVGTYSINGITKPNSSGSSSSRGVSMFKTTSSGGKLSLLMIWYQFMNWNKILMEITQRNIGSGSNNTYFEIS
jgi:hypothetical protein